MNFYLICCKMTNLKLRKLYLLKLLFFIYSLPIMSDPVNNASPQKSTGNSNSTVPKPEQPKIIQPTVNKTAQTHVEPTNTITNLDNHSIINQKQNEIPSLKEQPKNHNQNQPAPINPSQKTLTQTKQQPHPINLSESNQIQTQPLTNPNQNNPPNTSKTENHPQKNDSPKLQPATQLSQTQTLNTNPSQNKPEPIKTETLTPKVQPTKKQGQSSHKIQQPSTTKQNQLSNPKKQTQKSTKEISTAKNIKNDQPLPQQKPHQKDSHEKMPQQKSDKNKAPEKTKQQHPTIPTKQQQKFFTPVQNKVMDSHDQTSVKIQEEAKKKQPQSQKNSEKQIYQKQKQHPSSKKPIEKHELPQSEEGVSFKQLLKLMLEKCKQKEQKVRTQIKSKIIQDDPLDINLSLASSQPSSEYPQSRIKLQFKLIQTHESKKFQQKKVPQSQQNEPKQPKEFQQSTQDKKSKVIQHKKQSDFNVAFYLYNLKEPKNKESVQNQKIKPINRQTLQKKLQQVTSSLDHSLFSYKVSEKDQSAQQKNKFPLTTVKFNFQQSLISTSLEIKPQLLDNLKMILKNIENPSQNSQIHKNETQQLSNKEPQTKNQLQNKQQAQLNLNSPKQNSIYFTTSTQLSLLSPLKDLLTTKFLTFISKGFKLRLQSKREKQLQPIHHHYLDKILRQAMFSLIPSLLNEYLASISSGSANIKFRSIEDLKKLLTRLGINQIFDQTPNTKEVLKELAQINLKSFFRVKPYSNEKKSQTQIQKNETQNENVSKGEVSPIWKIIETVFNEANCNGLSIEMIVYERFCIKLTVESCSLSINKLWSEIMK